MTIPAKLRLHYCYFALIAALLAFSPRPAMSADEAVRPAQTDVKTGPSGLPLPRFVSLKADRVNVRKGPSTEHGVDWIYKRVGLPVEIIQEFEHWRRVRDSEGSDGWVYHSLLSGRRTALIMPWSGREGDGGNKQQVSLHASPSAGSATVVKVEPGVLANILSCTGQWCHLSLSDYRGWVQQEKLWGVYRGEKVN